MFQESKEFEYIHKPNQDLKIYRNRFVTNEFSMRSDPINKEDTLVVLLIGDSVVNGGNQVDHKDLASTILEQRLRKDLNATIRVLNISSYTWGPDNIYAYLKKYGTFNADLIVMVNNSGDAFDNMTFKKVVGVKSSMPSDNYALASFKLFKKVNDTLLSKFKKGISEDQDVQPEGRSFNTGFNDIDSLATCLKVPLIVYLHASQKELVEKKYSQEGQLIIDFFTKRNRKVIKELDFALDKKYYLDEIHFNSEGQHFMGENLYRWIYKAMKG
ncbi:hypothetical protein ACFQ4C_29695 [Larkinella insperata]|uniref:SGNH/GDSL hydrolase family protein n=1 Tax=Larkinella insperata TaxID=332158 RepID=A0ABW3QCD1_9BACT|nr:hypothetical protein [Larkinella insperata]